MKKRITAFFLLLVAALTFILAACGGPAATPSISGVTVSGGAATHTMTEDEATYDGYITPAFTARVTAINDPDETLKLGVIWAITPDGATISPSGVVTVTANTATTYTILAKSEEDAIKIGTTTLTITPYVWEGDDGMNGGNKKLVNDNGPAGEREWETAYSDVPGTLDKYQRLTAEITGNGITVTYCASANDGMVAFIVSTDCNGPTNIGKIIVYSGSSGGFYKVKVLKNIDGRGTGIEVQETLINGMITDIVGDENDLNLANIVFTGSTRTAEVWRNIFKQIARIIDAN